ncbi:MAG: O-antigen ligase family protein [Patescibacteria group bacterium]
MDRIVVTALIAVAALLPFERLGGFDVAGFNVRPSQVALAAAWLFFACTVLRHVSQNGTWTISWRRPAFLALAGFFAAAGLSLLNAENFERSLVVLGFTIFTASLAFLMPNALHAEDLPRVRKVVLIAAALVGLFGLWQFVGDMLGAPTWMTGLRSTYSRAILGFTRVQSTAAEPLYFANYLLLPVALAGAWLLHAPESRTSRLLIVLLGLLTLCIFLTSSRGGWLGLGVTALALLWLERRRLKDWKPLASGLGVGLAALALGVFLLGRFFSPTLSSVPETFFRHVTTITDGAAFDDRTRTMSAALDAWKRHPWIGVGYGGYGPYVAASAFSAPDAGWPIANNETLELLAETGIIGLATFLIFLFTLFREAASSGRRGRVPAEYPLVRSGDAAEAVRVACLAALLGMLAQYQTFSTLYIMHVWFTAGLLLATLTRRAGN